MDIKSLQNKTIAKIFYDIGHKIENGTCGLEPDELMSMANKLLHIKLNIDQTCKYLNCSRATLYRMVADGRIPRPNKEPGGKEYWYQDELDNYISRANY